MKSGIKYDAKLEKSPLNTSLTDVPNRLNNPANEKSKTTDKTVKIYGIALLINFNTGDDFLFDFCFEFACFDLSLKIAAFFVLDFK